MYKVKTIVFVGLSCFFFFSASVFATTQGACEGEAGSSRYFPNTLIVSQKISKSFCETSDFAAQVPSLQYPGLKVLLDLWRNTIIEESRQLIDAGIDLQPHFEKLLVDFGTDKQKGWPGFSVNRDIINGGYRFNIDRSGLPNGAFDDAVNAKCETLPDYKVDCFTVLVDLKQAVNAYKIPMVLAQTDEALKKLKFYSSEWEQYFTKARSQTPWELALNSVWYKDEITSPAFVLPPQYQVIMLHPNILLEYIGAADEGNQLKEALAVEWVGINFWNIKLPLGVSLMSTYSDRAGVSDVGHGVLFHIYNHYSLGITNNDGETGVSVSIDLFKLFESNKERIEKYEKYIDGQ